MGKGDAPGADPAAGPRGRGYKATTEGRSLPVEDEQVHSNGSDSSKRAKHPWPRPAGPLRIMQQTVGHEEAQEAGGEWRDGTWGAGTGRGRALH